MTKITILLVLTFVFGVLRLLTHTKLFDQSLVGIFEALIPLNNAKPIVRSFFHWLSTVFFYFSLCFQTWYWIFLD